VLWSSVKLLRHQLCLLALFYVKIDFDLNLNFDFSLVLFEFSFHLVQFVDEHAVHVRRKHVSFSLFVKVMDEVQHEFVKSFQSRSWLSALLKTVQDVEDELDRTED